VVAAPSLEGYVPSLRGMVPSLGPAVRSSRRGLGGAARSVSLTQVLVLFAREAVTVSLLVFATEPFRGELLSCCDLLSCSDLFAWKCLSDCCVARFGRTYERLVLVRHAVIRGHYVRVDLEGVWCKEERSGRATVKLYIREVRTKVFESKGSIELRRFLSTMDYIDA